MEKTILVPTDFSVKSLQPVKAAIHNNMDVSLNIVLVHGYLLSTSISDLLFYSDTKIIRELESDDFISSCQVLKSRYANQINSFRVELFTGSVQSAFNSFLKVAGIDEIYFYEKNTYQDASSRGFDIRTFIRKSKVKQYGIEGYQDHKDETEPLAEILFSRQTAS